MAQLFVHGGIVSQDSINRGIKSDVGVVIEEVGEGHGGECPGQRADAVDRLGIGGHRAVTAALSSVVTENNLSMMQDANRHSCNPEIWQVGPAERSVVRCSRLKSFSSWCCQGHSPVRPARPARPGSPGSPRKLATERYEDAGQGFRLEERLG